MVKFYHLILITKSNFLLDHLVNNWELLRGICYVHMYETAASKYADMYVEYVVENFVAIVYSIVLRDL